MRRSSIRARLTAWSCAIVALGMLGLALGSWWILARGIRHNADSELQSRIAGLRAFIEHAEAQLSDDALRDEFNEYAELTHGEVLIDVRDATGASLIRPSLPGWDVLVAQAPVATPIVRCCDGTLAGRPYRIATAEVTVREGTHRVIFAAPMTAAHDALARMGLLFAFVMPALVALAAGATYVLTGRVLAPVARISREVRAITVRSLDQRLKLPPAEDELHDLARTFNEMLARLEASVSDIVRFTADASHELRTPIARARTTAELALRRERSPSDYRQALGAVLEETEHMTRLVQELLALAREDAGIEAPEAASFDLIEVAREAERAIHATAEGRGVSVRLQAPPESIDLRGDAAGLARLFAILLENAVAYTPAGGEIRIRVSNGALLGHAVLEVADTGIGIDPQDLPRVFERFYRGADARDRAPQGSGLGLAIAKTIVDRFEGTIRIESSAPGCRVLVELPRRTPPQAS